MATLTTTADDVQALVQLLQRTLLTRAEALYIERLFNDWLNQLAERSADVLAPDPPDAPGTSDQANQALPAGVASTNGSDQVQSI